MTAEDAGISVFIIEEREYFDRGICSLPCSSTAHHYPSPCEGPLVLLRVTGSQRRHRFLLPLLHERLRRAPAKQKYRYAALLPCTQSRSGFVACAGCWHIPFSSQQHRLTLHLYRVTHPTKHRHPGAQYSIRLSVAELGHVQLVPARHVRHPPGLVPRRQTARRVHRPGYAVHPRTA